MKRKYKNACKGIESLNTAFNELLVKHEKIVKTHEKLCEQNKVLN